METKKITIINSRTQSQNVINNSSATTLGELKAEMRENGIDYEGMTFFEGHMRAELIDDQSTLPTNIPYKGEIVNDLVFMLTTPDKKVKSGAMTRAEAYSAVKELGLQEECKERFGKNFTQCSTADLVKLVESTIASNKSKEVAELIAKNNTQNCDSEDINNIKEAIKVLIKELSFNDYLAEVQAERVLKALSGEKESITSGIECEKKDKIDQDTISEMFGYLGY